MPVCSAVPQAYCCFSHAPLIRVLRSPGRVLIWRVSVVAGASEAVCLCGHIHVHTRTSETCIAQSRAKARLASVCGGRGVCGCELDSAVTAAENAEDSTLRVIARTCTRVYTHTHTPNANVSTMQVSHRAQRSHTAHSRLACERIASVQAP